MIHYGRCRIPTKTTLIEWNQQKKNASAERKTTNIDEQCDLSVSSTQSHANIKFDVLDIRSNLI